jgi:antitoxin (DNA-binding transcriptional repressor) of toxin-antitoxin stability system
MNEPLSIHLAKTRLSQLIPRLEVGEEIVIARRRKPVAKLVPVAPRPKRLFGALKVKESIGPEFFEPLPPEELDTRHQGPPDLWTVRLLLDTHALLWWITGDEALSEPAREAIADPANEVFISAASAWEIATKHRLGR